MAHKNKRNSSYKPLYNALLSGECLTKDEMISELGITHGLDEAIQKTSEIIPLETKEIVFSGEKKLFYFTPEKIKRPDLFIDGVLVPRNGKGLYVLPGAVLLNYDDAEKYIENMGELLCL